MWGYDTAEEQIGRQIFDFWARNISDREKSIFFKRLKSKGYSEQTEVGFKKSGERFDVRFSASLVTDQNGEPLCIMGFFADITQQKRAEEELRLKSMAITNTRSAIAFGDMDANIIYANPALARMWGYNNTAELIGKNAIHFMASKREGISAFERVRKQGYWSGELLGRKKDGTHFHSLASGSVVSDDEGRPLMLMCFFEDISELKTIEEALRKSEQKFRTMFQNHSAMMYLADPSTLRFVGANEAALDFYGYSLENIMNMKLTDISVKEESSIKGDMKSVLQGESLDTVITKHRLSNGELRDVEIRSTALEVDEGKTVFFAVVNDVSDRLQMERQLVESANRLGQQTAELEQLNRELESFSYSVSHDLRSPIHQVLSYVELLKDEAISHSESERNKYLEKVERAAVNMNSLIEALLRLAKASREDLKREKIDVSRLVKQLAAVQKTTDLNHQVELVVEQDLSVIADPELLSASLDNLLSNARKFTRDRENARIEFGAKTIDGERVFYLRDNGIGLDMDDTTDVFSPFSRYHDANKYEGSGIGLATVKRIINRHGGRIWMESRKDSGATFYFTLPDTDKKSASDLLTQGAE
jgi:PAS domain S-box-containing protein